MTWSVPTYSSVNNVPVTDLVGCLQCGRTVSADMLFDLGPVLHLIGFVHQARFGCDGCKEKLFRHRHLTKAVYLKACGASDELVEKHMVDG